VVDVKKWDKQVAGEEWGRVFLDARLGMSGFLKRDRCEVSEEMGVGIDIHFSSDNDYCY